MRDLGVRLERRKVMWFSEDQSQWLGAFLGCRPVLVYKTKSAINRNGT